jgi:hypothetical protein
MYKLEIQISHTELYVKLNWTRDNQSGLIYEKEFEI